MKRRFFLNIFLTIVLVVTAITPTYAVTDDLSTNTVDGIYVDEVKAIVPSGAKAASYSYNKIKVSWDKINGVDGYQVYRATSKNGKYSKVYSTSDVNKVYYINGSRTSGKTYYYKVRGYKKVSGKTYYTQYSGVVSSYARPNKVKVDSLDVSLGWYSYFNLDWKPISGASGYQVYMKEKGKSAYVWMGNFKSSQAKVEFDERFLYDIKVRAYKIVNGKKVYGLFSEPVSYEPDWNADMLKKAGEDFFLKTYSWGVLSDECFGIPKTPDNSSWSATYPLWYSYYEKWEDVKADLEEAIESDMKGYDYDMNYVCFYIDEFGEGRNTTRNTVQIYMLN